MKTTVILTLLCVLSLSVFSQKLELKSLNVVPSEYSYYTNYAGQCEGCKKEKKVEDLKPYASVGAGVSSNLNTYAAEVGLYNHSYWVAIVAEFTPDQGSTQVYMGPKFYKTLCDVTKESQLLAYGALKLHLNHVRDFAFEPGICYVYSFCDKFALQISASTPIYEGQALGKPTNLSGGLGINWWIR